MLFDASGKVSVRSWDQVAKVTRAAHARMMSGNVLAVDPSSANTIAGCAAENFHLLELAKKREDSYPILSIMERGSPCVALSWLEIMTDFLLA